MSTEEFELPYGFYSPERNLRFSPQLSEGIPVVVNEVLDPYGNRSLSSISNRSSPSLSDLQNQMNANELFDSYGNRSFSSINSLQNQIIANNEQIITNNNQIMANNNQLMLNNIKPPQDPNGPNVTTEEVILNIQGIRYNIDNEPGLKDQLAAIEANQRARERQLTIQTCPSEVLNFYANSVDNIDSTRLRAIAQQDLGQAEIQKTIGCIVQGIGYLDQSGNTEVIKKYFRNLRMIGKESVEGNAFLTDFKDAKDMFVIKAAKDANKDTMIHEVIVGLYGTNKLRSLIPNFAYIYGGFSCTSPLIENGQLLDWCSKDGNNVHYVIYENINDSVSLEKYLYTATPQEFLDVYMQLVYSLKIANEACDYTHYDLHSNNILIRRMNDLKYIKYGDNYILTRDIATIIDYGYSHIQYNGEHFGKSNLVKYSVFPYRSWIFYDVYRVLMSCAQIASSIYRIDMLRVIEPLFRFFNKTDALEDAVREQASEGYSFPYNDTTKDLNIDDYINYIYRNLNVSDFITEYPQGYEILQCEGFGCFTDQDIAPLIVK